MGELQKMASKRIKWKWELIRDRDPKFYLLRGLGLGDGKSIGVWLPSELPDGFLDNLKNTIEKVWSKQK